jgi:hypothetical protein
VVEAHQEPSMVTTFLEIIKNERCFFYIVHHREQIEKQGENPFIFGCADICTKYLYYGRFSIFYHHQNMDAKKSSKANKIRANFLETNTLIF